MGFATVQGDFLQNTDGILVHGCNCVGGFGRGIAGQIRSKWPSVARAHESWFKQNPGKDRMLGDVQILVGQGVQDWALNLPADKSRKALSYIDQVLTELPPGLVLVNGFTQFYFGGDRTKHILYADYDAISAVFAKVAGFARIRQAHVNFPLIGAGLANGDWNEISPRIEAALAGVPSTFWQFVPPAPAKR